MPMRRSGPTRSRSSFSPPARPPQPVWRAYEELALAACGERVLWITGYGATETAPFAMSTNQGAARAGTVGLPVDGLEMKLAPVEGKLEARFRGPNITPGYWRAPALTAACSPFVQDCVVTGHDRNEVGALVFLNIAASKDKSREEIHKAISSALALLAKNSGSSMHPTRVLILDEPPSIDAGELTDKGSINQRAVLERRAGLVELLYREPTEPAVIVSAR